MAFASFDTDDGDVLSEINMIPLIDVMLVLLIVFMVTVPVMQHSVNVALPQAASQPLPPQDKPVLLGIQADGRYRWNQTPISDEQLEQRLLEWAAKGERAPLQIHGDKAARYERVAQAMAAAQRAGIRSIGFVTEP